METGMKNSKGIEIRVLGKNTGESRDPSHEFWSFANKFERGDGTTTQWNIGGFLDELHQAWLYHKYGIYLDRSRAEFVQEIRPEVK